VDETLGRGDSDWSYYLLKQAGIDMATPDPYQALIRRMNHQWDELEELLKHKKLSAD
jgi:oligoendopeptidase F